MHSADPNGPGVDSFDAENDIFWLDDIFDYEKLKPIFKKCGLPKYIVNDISNEIFVDDPVIQSKIFCAPFTGFECMFLRNFKNFTFDNQHLPETLHTFNFMVNKKQY